MSDSDRPGLDDFSNVEYVYQPDFLHTALASFDRDPSADNAICIRDKLSNEQWVGTEVLAYLETLYPKPHEISGRDASRNKDSFILACEKVFRKGRVFASFKQLQQVAKILLDKWGARAVVNGKYIVCSYSPPPKRKPPALEVTKRKYKAPESLKKLYQCPFKIQWAFCQNDTNLPSILRSVKITRTNFTHECELSTTFLRVAKKAAGCLNHDHESIKQALLILRQNPSADARLLRPFLQQAFPHWHAVESHHVANFRRFSRRYWLKHPHDEPPVLDSTDLKQVMAQNSPSDDHIDFDDPMVSVKYKQLLATAMHETGMIWRALKFLELAREETPGFAFKIQRNAEGLPVCITWMTARMRMDLLRFGDTLFLDAQKRQYNKWCFPYSALVMINEENKVCTGCEALYVEESPDGYANMINAVRELEPRWNPERVKFVFGDLMINQALLDRTGMVNAMLRCDSWHLLNEVWPKPDSFGRRFDNISLFLRNMIESRTEEQWNSAYELAKRNLEGDLALIGKLDAIFKNPSYYAGYALERIEGNLGKRGDSHAEQNHASIVAHLGNGASFDPAEHIQKLLDRHLHLITQRNNVESKHRVQRHKYKSPYRVDSEKRADLLACQALSSYAHTNFFNPSLQSSRRLQVHSDDNGGWKAWAAGKDELEVDSADMHVFSDSLRCSCSRRRNFLVQCGAELSQFGFDAKLWSPRWYNHQYFCQTVMDFHASGFWGNKGQSDFLTTGNTAGRDPQAKDGSPSVDVDVDVDMDGEVDSDLDDDVDGVEFNDNNTDVDSVGEPNADSMRKDTSVVGFNDVILELKHIVSHIQNDQDELRKWFSFAIDVKTALRAGKRVEIHSTTHDENTSGTMNTRFLSNASHVKRKKSSMEIHRRKKPKSGSGHMSHVSTVPILDEIDANIMTRNTQQNRKCSLCQVQGHRNFTCPMIKTFGAIVQRGDGVTRERIVNDIINTTSPLELLPLPGDTVIHTSFPRTVSAVVLHHRYVNMGRIYVEASLVTDGEIKPDHCEKVFEKHPVVSWIHRSNNKPMVNAIPLVDHREFENPSTQPRTSVVLNQPLSQIAMPQIMMEPIAQQHSISNFMNAFALSQNSWYSQGQDNAGDAFMSAFRHI